MNQTILVRGSRSMYASSLSHSRRMLEAAFLVFSCFSLVDHIHHQSHLRLHGEIQVPHLYKMKNTFFVGIVIPMLNELG